ncbi:type III secretion protein HrpF [Pseudomonas mucidolens]|uniref:HrpF protein n=1 Tax=Pseudomonas mucidolens TaxID=46679 RepID=A0A1H2NGX8_9PSED|nr:type III secretion protein HrpF [Pseudomonas mucidolens]SDV04640.1 HrpF protein [Pseudomonas mucidolens]SQH31956.1 type III secretion protein HrpF [Pseudomonas mucidolens]
MATYESVQRGIDSRFLQAQKAVDDIAMNNTGSLEDVQRFHDAMKGLQFASAALKEQTRLKSSLSKTIIDAIQ